MLTPTDEKLAIAPLEGIIAGEQSPPETSGNRRVYVGNLSWSTAWQSLKDHMKQAGEVTRADVLQDAQGRSKGCGLVEFKTAAQARNAIVMLNNSELDGRQIFIREDREAAAASESSQSGSQSHPSGQTQHRLDPAKQNCRVYVGNLSWNVDREQLRQHMTEAGEVVYAEVLTEPSGRSKGCGIVEYKTPEQAQNAIQTLHNTTLNSRPMFVREDREATGSVHSSGGAAQQGGHNGAAGGHATGAAAPMPIMMGHVHPHMMPPHPHMMQQQQPPQQQPQQAGQHGPRMGPPHNRPLGTRVYVGNLSYEVAWQDLKDHMRKVGNVVHADVLEDHEGRSKGCGIVEYDNPHAAVRAIRELNNSELKGRLVFVREDREDRKLMTNMGMYGAAPMGGGPVMHAAGGGVGAIAGQQGTAHGHGPAGAGASGGGRQPPSAAGRQLFVSNLDFDVTWQDLKDHFKGFEVQRAEVAYDAEGRSKGFGTVRFATAAEAQRALEVMNHTQLHSRQVELREDQRVA